MYQKTQLFKNLTHINMGNLKLRHFIPIFGVDSHDQTTGKENFILLVYNLVVITATVLIGTSLLFKYVL